MYIYYDRQYSGYVIQWNPVNMTTFGPWKTGRINGAVVRRGSTVVKISGFVCEKRLSLKKRRKGE